MEAAAETLSGAHIGRSTFLLKALRDRGLVKLAAGGSDEAFSIIYERYHGPVFAYCVSILRDYSEAEDALNEVMLRTHQALLSGSDREIDIKPWLFRCARNHCINVIHRRRHRDEVVVELYEEGERVDQVVERNEQLREVLGDLAGLPEEQKAALVMREAAGLSHEAIAEALDVNAAKAKRLLFEARRSLSVEAEGREMACAQVRYQLSDGDGRTSRKRELRSHLKSCDSCREFQDTIKRRKAVFAAGLPILAPTASAAILAKLFGASAAQAASGTGAGAVVGAGKGLGVGGKLFAGATIFQKGAVIVAVTSIVAAGGYEVTKAVRGGAGGGSTVGHTSSANSSNHGRSGTGGWSSDDHKSGANSDSHSDAANGAAVAAETSSGTSETSTQSAGGGSTEQGNDGSVGHHDRSADSKPPIVPIVPPPVTPPAQVQPQPQPPPPDPSGNSGDKSGDGGNKDPKNTKPGCTNVTNVPCGS